VQPEWSAVVCFDDGTGECFLHVDTAEDVFAFLTPAAPTAWSSTDAAGNNLSSPGAASPGSWARGEAQGKDRVSLQELVEVRVRAHGYLRYLYRYRQSKKNAHIANINAKRAVAFNSARERDKDNSNANANELNEYWIPADPEEMAHADMKPEDVLQAAGGGGGAADSSACEEERLLDEYIEECDFSVPVEVHCRLIFLKNCHGKGISTMTRAIKVQRGNAANPWVAFGEDRNTLRAEDLKVQVTAVQSLGPRRVHVEAWRQLRALRSLGIGSGIGSGGKRYP